VDAQTRENWRRIRDHIEAAGKTDNHYYRRGLAILAEMSDPFDRYHVIERARPDDGGTQDR